MEIPSAWHPAVAIRHRVAGSFHRTTCLRPSTHCPTADASADHAAALRATGTDDATAADDAHCHPKCHQRANESTRSDTNAHGEDKRTDDGATATIDSRKALRLTKDSDEVRARAIQRVNAGGGTRTHTGCDPQRILNPSRPSRNDCVTNTCDGSLSNPRNRHRNAAQDMASDYELASIVDALATLPEADRPAIVKHLTALAKLGPRKLAAIVTLTDDSIET